jgi:hypothetical protein
MKHLSVFVILFFIAFGLKADAASTGNLYGGEIFFRNASSCNIYLEFDVADNPFATGEFSRQFCLEKRDAIINWLRFFVPFADDQNFDKESAYPKNHIKSIRIYNMDTGALLAELNPSDKEIFILIERKYEPDLYTLTIEDSLFIRGSL